LEKVIAFAEFVKARRAARAFGIRVENGGQDGELEEIGGVSAVAAIDGDVAGG
jgi:hypothetical protein